MVATVTRKLTLRWRVSAIRAWSWNLNLDNLSSSIFFSYCELFSEFYLLLVEDYFHFTSSIYYHYLNVHVSSGGARNIILETNFPAMWGLGKSSTYNVAFLFWDWIIGMFDLELETLFLF